MKFVALCAARIDCGGWHVYRWDFRPDGVRDYHRLVTPRVFTKRKWAERYIRRALVHRPKNESWVILAEFLDGWKVHALDLGFRLTNIKTSGQGCVPITGCVPRGHNDSFLIGCIADKVVRPQLTNKEHE